MFPLGDYNTTETVNIPFNSFSSNDPSASVTITNLAAGDIEIHKDGSITQRASDNGVTVSIDFDGITGNHMIHIDLSDNSDSGFYAAGSRYEVRIEGTTIDAGTVNAWVGVFSIGTTLRPTTAGRTLEVDASGSTDANAVSATAPFFQDFFTVDSGEVSGAEISGSVILEIVKVAWDRVLTGATHNISTSAGRRLRQVEAATVHASGVIATVTNGHTFTLDAGAVATTDYYIGDRLEITEGVGAGQSRLITDYTSGKVCTLDSDFTTNPNTASLYDVVAADVHVSLSDADLAGGFVATYTNTTTITLDSAAVGTTDYYKDMVIIFTHGTGKGQSRQITAYTAGRVCTLSPALTTALDTTTGWHITANAGTERLGGMSTGMKAEVQVECDASLTSYDGPTDAEMVARTLVAANYFDPAIDTVVNVTNVANLAIYTGNTKQTGDNFARIGSGGAGLTAINLPNQTMDITGSLSGSVGSVTGAVGSVTGAVGSVTGNVGGNVTGSVASVTGDVGGISDAGLAEFMTVDTLETTAAAGSVAKISQGSAGGNVTVGAMTAAALAQFVTVDTTETTAVSGSVAEISQGSGGGSSIDVSVSFSFGGTGYCTRSDINDIFGTDNVTTWADLNNDSDGDVITARVARSIAWATTEINDRLRGGPYEIPLPSTVAATITDLCATLAGVWLYRSRGVDDESEIDKYKWHWDRVEKTLSEIRAGKRRLDATPSTDTGGQAPFAV